MVCECCVEHRAFVRSASQFKTQTRKQSLLFLVETRGMSGWSSDTRLRKFGLVQIGRPPLETRPRPCRIFHQLSPGALKILGLKALPCCPCLKVRFWQSYSLCSDLMTKGEHRNGLSPCLKTCLFWQSYSLCSFSEDFGVGFGTVVHGSKNLVLTDLFSVTAFENEKRCMSPPWPMPWC